MGTIGATNPEDTMYKINICLEEIRVQIDQPLNVLIGCPMQPPA